MEGKISPENRAYALFAMKCRGLRKRTVQQDNILQALLYHILKKEVQATEESMCK